VHLPGHTGLRLVNESFGDGPQGVVDALKSNFGIPINHYVEMDFAGFRSIVDALGGVRMFIPAPSRDKMTGLDIKTAGCVTLDGPQALAWVRSRYYTYYEAGKWRTDPTSDLGRIRRQQDFIHQLMGQVVEKGALNPLRANRLADAALAKLTVDKDFSVRDALRLVEAFRPAGTAGIEMLTLPTRPVGAHLLPTSASEAVLGRLRPAAPAPAAGEATAAIGPQSALGNRKGTTRVTAPAPGGASPHPAC
jgi:LCP family protein required for cell wall assembly